MNILLAEDDRESRISIGSFLTQLGHHVEACENGMEALELFQKGRFNLVLTDIKMPKMNGISLLQKLKAASLGEAADVVLFTGHGDMESVITALRLGASDYLLKPINVRELADIIDRVAEKQAVRQAHSLAIKKAVGKISKNAATKTVQSENLDNALSRVIGIGEIGVFSRQMKDVILQALKLHEDRTIPVLIEGETGTGKEVIARLIHYGRTGTEAPFIDVNCATLTPSLFESELFGYEAGAYTGALSRGSKGKLDVAAGGTLFLDEIGEISVELQAKLLRVIQEREFYRIGGLKKINIDIRVVCATNVNLEDRVKQGGFRPDLFYRLNLFHVRIPPLRERPDDIIRLAAMFLKELSSKKNKGFKRISSEAARILSSYNWPGNVRELRNVIEWVVFSHDAVTVEPEHLKIITKDDAEPVADSSLLVSAGKGYLPVTLPPKGMPLEELTDKIIYQVLLMHDGNKARTARYLNMSRRALYSRLEKMGKR